MPKPLNRADKHRTETSPQTLDVVRVQQPNSLRILTAPGNSTVARQLRRLELVEKLPQKLYEELAAVISNDAADGKTGCPNLEFLSLAGSCCGDAATQV